MNPGHDLSPDVQVIPGLSGAAVQLVVVVISGPYTGCIIGRKAYKPDVVVVRGRTGLSGDVHAREICSRTGSGAHYILHGAGQKPRGCVLQHSSRIRRRVVDQHISIMIENPRVEYRLCIDTAVGNRRVRSRQFNIFHAVRQSAQSQRLPVIVLAVLCGLGLDSRKAQVFQVGDSKLRRDIRQRLDRHDVHRVHNTGTQ